MATTTVAYDTHTLTPRSLTAGTVLAVVLAAVNAYLTLSFGIMEEGPGIAATFFYASVTILALSAVTVSEMVMVATMGSAGGTMGFMANYFAARTMVGSPMSVGAMILFTFTVGVVGLLAAILLRQILVIQNEKLPEDERLPWVGARMVHETIVALVESTDSRQVKYLVCVMSAAFCVVFFNEEVFGMIPEAIPLGKLALVGGAVALAPLCWGGAYMVGLRTSLGFLVGATALLVLAPYTPDPAAPHRFVWPGVTFLTVSGLTALALEWRTIWGGVRSLFGIKAGADDDPVTGKKTLVAVLVVVLPLVGLCLHYCFFMTVTTILVCGAVGGILLDLIGARASSQTYVNPVRVLAILLQGVGWMMGVTSPTASIDIAGLMAGTSVASCNLTSDFAFGRWFRVFARWQFWSQVACLMLASVTVALTYYFVAANNTIAFSGGDIGAPIARAWVALTKIIDPASRQALPAFAVESAWVAGILAVAYVLFERYMKRVQARKDDARKAVRTAAGIEDDPEVESRRLRLIDWIPGATGIGIALILNPGLGFAFFGGGVLTCLILFRLFRMKDATLNIVAVACIMGQGVGDLLRGIVQSVVKFVYTFAF